MSESIGRGAWLKLAARVLGLGALGGVFGGVLWRGRAGERSVWQIDPRKCIQCGRCESECVVKPSAVKCVHSFEMCGYCKLCFGYFQPDAKALSEAAENQLCPTGAIKRRFVEAPYFEYTIDEGLCTGCAKCVKSCGDFGNGSLFLQIRQDACKRCNACRIAERCPSGAIKRVPARRAYLSKVEESAG